MAIAPITSEPARTPDVVELPAATPWPIVLAFGTTLLVAGLVTSVAVSALGGVLMIAGGVGWFRDVLPHEAHDAVPARPDVTAATTSRRTVTRLEIPGVAPRAWLPLEVYPVSAGIKGGLAGSVAMAVLAMMYGLLSERSIWYPINLLAAGFFPAAVTATTAQLAAFHLNRSSRADPPPDVAAGQGALWRDAAVLPRRPILLRRVIAPLVWSGLLYTVLGIISGAHQRIAGCGSRCRRSIWDRRGHRRVAPERVGTWQPLPFAVRAGSKRGMIRERPRTTDHEPPDRTARRPRQRGLWLRDAPGRPAMDSAVSPRQGRRLRRALRHQLRRMPWRERHWRRRDRARRSRVPRRQRRRDDPSRHGRRRSGNRHARVRPQRRRSPDRRADRRPRERHPRPLGEGRRATRCGGSPPRGV
jgi:hypothetical protein